MGAKASDKNELEVIEAIRYSISQGQNHLDCAELYGAFYTDELVGKAIAGLERADLFIADKLWSSSVGVGLVLPTVNKMLEKLNTDYLDMLYIHAPWPEANWQEAIPQIDELIDEGIVGAFGVSNFTVSDMQTAMKISRHPIAANQMNYNVLYKDEVDAAFKNYCSDNNVQIIAYQPVKRQAVLANSVIQDIAEGYGATPAQVALAWLVAQGALPIPKAVNLQHIAENVQSVQIKLSEQDLQRLNRL